MIVSHFLVAVIHIAASHANLDAFFGREGDKLEMGWIRGDQVIHRFVKIVIYSIHSIYEQMRLNAKGPIFSSK